MSDIIDPKYFQALSERNPTDILRNSLCRYDDRKAHYQLSVWDDEILIVPDHLKIHSVEKDSKKFHEFFSLFIIYYLLYSKPVETSGEWISEKDIPGGPTFFRGPHEIPTHLISQRFGNDTGGFKKRCAHLNGTPLDMADAAFRFNIVPRIPVAVLYWTGDDDFPAESKILFDKTIMAHLTSDIVFALAVGVCDRLGKPFE